MRDPAQASLDASGYVREKAVRKLAAIRDGSELLWLLLRLNDWVPQVRDAARDAVLDRLHADYALHFLRYLDVVSKLETVRRTDQQDIVQKISALLTAPPARAMMLEALNSPAAIIRRMAFRILSSSEDLRSFVEAALASRDPILRRWAVRLVPPLAEADAILERLSHDRVAAVRREVLAARAASLSDEALQNALLDGNASVREIARFHLMQRNTIDVARHYRDALGSSAHIVAILGLGETGKSADADLLIPYFEDPHARVRRAAIRSVARLAGDVHQDRIVERLSDAAPSVAAEARRALHKRAASVGGDVLWMLFHPSSPPYVRKNALLLIMQLPKWESLPLLLRATMDAEPHYAEIAREAVVLWNRGYNRRSTPPSREQLTRVDETFRSLPHDSLPAAVHADLAFTLQTLR